MNDEKIEQQIIDNIFSEISKNNNDLTEKEIISLVKEEIVKSKYPDINDWHLDYVIERITEKIRKKLLYTKAVANNNEITVVEADKKAKNSLNFSWISIPILLLGTLYGSDFILPLSFSVIQYVFIAGQIKKALQNNTSIPEVALRAKTISRILLVIGLSISLIKFVVFFISL